MWSRPSSAFPATWVPRHLRMQFIRNLNMVGDYDPKLVLILAGDHVYIKWITVN